MGEVQACESVSLSAARSRPGILLTIQDQFILETGPELFCLYAPLAATLRCRHPVFVEVFGRKSNLVIPIDGPAVEGVVSEVLWVLELCENAFVVDAGEVESTHVTVAEGELQQVAGDILGGGDV